MRTVWDGITSAIIGSAIHIHQRLGPGLLESAYEAIMERELLRAGLRVQRQKAVDIVFNGWEIPRAYTVDLLVNESVVVELKSVEFIAPVHRKQVLTYLKLLNLNVGLLINFGAPTIKDGLQRILNDPQPLRALRDSV